MIDVFVNAPLIPSAQASSEKFIAIAYTFYHALEKYSLSTSEKVVFRVKK